MSCESVTASTASVARLGAVADWWRSWLMANTLPCLCSCQWWTFWTYLVTVNLFSLYLMNFMLYSTLDTVGNILRVHYKSMKCDVSFSQGSASTLFRWGEPVFHVCVKMFFLLTAEQNYKKNQTSFSRVNVLPRFLWITVYIGHARVCVSLSLTAFPHYCTDLDVTWGIVCVPSSCALLGGFAIGGRCYDNTAPNAKCQWVLVLALCLVEMAAARGVFLETLSEKFRILSLSSIWWILAYQLILHAPYPDTIVDLGAPLKVFSPSECLFYVTSSLTCSWVWWNLGNRKIQHRPIKPPNEEDRKTAH